MSVRFTDTAIFEKIVKSVFKKVDADKSGQIDDAELTIALAMVHSKLAEHAPGVTGIPTKEEVKNMMRNYDTDQDGKLSEQEFCRFARNWFEKKGANFLLRVIMSVFVSMIALPQGAEMLHGQLPVAKHMPKKAFTLVFGVIWKFVSMRIGRA